MIRTNRAPAVQVSGAAALLLLPLTLGFGAVVTGLYLILVTFIMNLFGVSIPVH